MNEAPFRKWRPNGPSPVLRRRIFGGGRGGDDTGLLNVPWIRTGFVVISVWMCSLTVVWSPGEAISPMGPAVPLPIVSVLVAQNALPVAGFTFTNPPSFPVTNTARSAQ